MIKTSSMHNYYKIRYDRTDVHALYKQKVWIILLFLV